MKEKLEIGRDTTAEGDSRAAYSRGRERVPGRERSARDVAVIKWKNFDGSFSRDRAVNYVV